MYRVLLGVSCLLLFVAGSNGQPCPDAVTMRQKIEQARAEPVQHWEPSFGRLKAWHEACRLAPDSNYATILFAISYANSTNQQFEQAYKLAQQSATINESGKPTAKPGDLCKIYYYIGYYLQNLDRGNEAIVAYRKSVRFDRGQPGNAVTVARSLRELASWYHEQGDYEKAVNSAELGYRYALTGNDALLMSENLYYSARGLAQLGRVNLAEKQIRQAIQLVAPLPNAAADRTIYRLRLAELLFLNQRPTDGLALYQTLIEEEKRAGQNVGYVYNDIGYQFLSVLKDYPKATYYFNQAYRQFTSPYEKANTLSNLALVAAGQQNYPQALALFQRSLTTYPLRFQPRTVADNPDLNEIRILSYKEKLLAIISAKADTWLAYAKAANNPQWLKNALQTYQVADQMIDFMRWEHTGQQSKLYWRQKTRGLYERAIETCCRLNNAEQAFRFFEKSRAVMLADKLNELGARQQLSPGQAREEQRLRHTLNEQQTQLAGLAPDSAAYAPARTALLLKQDSLDTFMKQIGATNPAYYRYKYDNTTPTLAELQHCLTSQQASFVTYFAGDSALYVLGITGGRATLIQQPIGSYRQTIRDFMPMLANPGAMRQTVAVRRFLTLGNHLYRQLLAPLNVPEGRVIVSPDGAFVPFETMSRTAGQPDYLVRYYGFSYAYSAGLLLKKAAEKPYLSGLKGHDFLGVAPVTFAPRLAQATLSGSDLALQSIAERFDAPVLLTHRAATRRAFLDAAPAYRFIQLFTHATADSTDAEPRLFFADSTLKLSDLADGALPNAQLVVLTACQTGLGVNQQGEGVFSLARGFAALGVPSMLTTLWSVEDRATYAIARLFYHYLDEGLPKDLALQRAKQDWLRTADGASQLPNVWAGLILVGNTEPLDRGSLWPFLAAGLLALTGAVALVWRFGRKRRAATPVISSLRSV